MQDETITHMHCACPHCDNFILLVVADYRHNGVPECPDCKILMDETSPRVSEIRRFRFLEALKALVR